MNLARLEGAIAISRFLFRFPAYSLLGLPLGGGLARFLRMLCNRAVENLQRHLMRGASEFSKRAMMTRRWLPQRSMIVRC
jgi:hypothetical protein